MPAAVPRTNPPRHLRRGWRSPGTGRAMRQGRAVSSWSPALAVRRFRWFGEAHLKAEHRTGYLAAFGTSASIRQGVKQAAPLAPSEVSGPHAGGRGDRREVPKGRAGYRGTSARRIWSRRSTVLL